MVESAQRDFRFPYSLECALQLESLHRDLQGRIQILRETQTKAIMWFDRQWLQAFLLTEMIEVPIYSLALQSFGWPVRLVGAFGASLLTHPLVWWSITSFGSEHYWAMIAISEAGAVVAEWFYLRLLGVPRAFNWSLIANGSSYTLGLICQILFGLP